MPNYNPSTGIAYGTIYLNDLDPDTAAYLWDQADNLSEMQALAELENDIRADLEQMVEDGELDEDEIEDEFQRRFDEACDYMQIYEPTLAGTLEGVKYEISHLGGAALLFVLESPHTGHYAPCSPCCPGAVSIGQPGSVLGYSIPFEWLPVPEEKCYVL